MVLPACGGGGTTVAAPQTPAPGASSTPGATPTASPSPGHTPTSSPPPVATPTATATMGASSTGLPAGAAMQASVAFPAGTAIDVSMLTAVNSCGTAPIGTTASTPGVRRRHDGMSNTGGTFTIPMISGAAQYVDIQNAAGTTTLVGFLSAAEPVVNAHTTAEVYVYLASFSFALPDAQRASVYASIATTPGFPAVETAVDAALVASHGTSAPSSDPGVQHAVLGLIDAIGSSQAMRLPAARGIEQLRRSLAARTPDDASFSGFLDSGLSIVPDAEGEYHFQNTLRRSALAFVDQVSHVNPNSMTPIDDQKIDSNPPKSIEAVHAIGSLGGVLVDLLEHKVAFAPTQSEPFPLKAVAGAKSTQYRIAIVGPGSMQADYSRLTPLEQNAQFDEAVSFTFVNVVFPLLATVAVPFAEIDKYIAGGPMAVEAVKSALTDTVAAFAARSDIQMAIAENKYEEVFVLVLEAVAGSPSLRLALATTVVKLLTLIGSTNAMAAEEFLSERLLPGFIVADAALGVADVAVVFFDLPSANRGTIVDVNVPGVRTSLQPGPKIELAPGSSVTLYAAVHPPQPGTLMYKYANSAKFGTLKDTTPTDIPGTNDFTTASKVVVYTAGNTAGIDEISVTPQLASSGSEAGEEYPEASVEIDVTKTALPNFSTTFGPGIPPQLGNLSLSGGGTITGTTTSLDLNFLYDGYDVMISPDGDTPSSVLYNQTRQTQTLLRNQVNGVFGDEDAPNIAELDITYPDGTYTMPEVITQILANGAPCSAKCVHTANVGYAMILFPDDASRNIAGNDILAWLGKARGFGTAHAPTRKHPLLLNGGR